MRTSRFWSGLERWRGAAAPALLVSLAAGSHAQPAGERHLQTANALLQRGLYGEAAQEYQAAIGELDEGDRMSEARYGRAIALQREGRVGDAIKQLTRIPDDSNFAFRIDAHVLMTSLLTSEGRFREAAEAAERVLNAGDHPARASTASLRVELLHRADEHARAVDAYMELDPPGDDRLSATVGRASFFAGLSRLDLAEGAEDHAQAARWLDRASAAQESQGFRGQASLLAARAWSQSGEPGRAERSYRDAIEHGSASEAARAGLGLASLQRAAGDASSAVETLRAIRDADLDPDLRARADLELGLAYLESDDPRRAARALDKAIEHDDSELEPTVQYWRAKADLRLGRNEEAAQRLEASFERSWEGPLRAETLYDLGVALERAGDAAGAQASFGTFRQRHADHRLGAEAGLAELTLAARTGDGTEIARLGERLLDRYPEFEQADRVRLVIAESSYNAGRHEASASASEALTSADDPEVARRARLLRGLSLHALDRPDEASEALRAAIETAEDEASVAPAWFALAEIEAGRGRWERTRDAASEYLSHAGPNAGSSPEARLLLGIAHARTGNDDEAVRVLEDAIDTHPSSDIVPHALLELGTLRLAQGNEREAREALTAVTEQHRETRFAPHALRALAGMETDELRAAQFYAEAAELGDDQLSGASVIDQATMLMRAGEHDEAADVLRGLDSEARLWRVIALSRAGRHRDALRAADSVEPETEDQALDDTYRYQLAVSLHAENSSDEAEGLLAELDPASELAPHAALLRSEILLDRGEVEEALETLDTVLEQDALARDDRLCAALRYRAAWCHYRLGNHDRIIELLGSMPCEAGEKASALALLLGEAYFAEGMSAQAAEQFETALEAGPAPEQAEMVLRRLGESRADAQDWPGSRRAFERHRREHTDVETWYVAEFGIGWALEHEDRHEDAIARYREVATNHSGETAARAQFQIGECLFALGRHEEAVRELLRVDILHSEPEWSAAALYEAGRCFEAMNKIGEARAQYREVIEQHADSAWAQAAGERLEAIAGPGGS